MLHPIRTCASLNKMLRWCRAQIQSAFRVRLAPVPTTKRPACASSFAASRRIRDNHNHELSGGKWNHLMDQTYLGYFDWQSHRRRPAARHRV